MNVYFDVDRTILSADHALRRGTHQVFARLVEDGHRVYLWSGLGRRTLLVEQRRLGPYLSGIFAKPLADFEAGLVTHEVAPRPDFVVDDYLPIVQHFGGYWIPDFFWKADDDDELRAVYGVINDLLRHGASTHERWWPTPPGADPAHDRAAGSA